MSVCVRMRESVCKRERFVFVWIERAGRERERERERERRKHSLRLDESSERWLTFDHSPLLFPHHKKFAIVSWFLSIRLKGVKNV